jgi:hypothetical protein
MHYPTFVGFTTNIESFTYLLGASARTSWSVFASNSPKPVQISIT